MSAYRSVVLVAFLCCLAFIGIAQTSRVYKYAVLFKDKDTLTYPLSKPHLFLSQRAMARRSKLNIPVTVNDIPVNNRYVLALKDKGIHVHNTSRWFNCAIVFVTNPLQEDSLRNLPFVKDVLDVGFSISGKTAKSTINLKEMLSLLEQKFSRKQERYKSEGNIYGSGLMQADVHGIPALHKAGLAGEHTLVAVVDAGFRNAIEIPIFLTALKRTVATYDIVDMEENVFDDDEHGTSVWSCMAAVDSFNLIGTSPAASYLLLRSEDALTEFPVEEFYWTIAAEFADSAGADILSTSLGYNEFGSSKYHHSHKELNGKTAWISKAAGIAVSKGMFVVCSAGNEGNAQWKLITFPADARDVLTVGAVDREYKHAGFSSVGFVDGTRVKPDVVAIGERTSVVSDAGTVYEGDGTSFACPVLAGGIACIWPLIGHLPASQIIGLIRLSSSQYYAPDKKVGFGVPDLILLKKMAQPYQTDTILDVRQLKDGTYHVALFVNSAQKVSVKMVNDKGKEVYRLVLHIKTKGPHRMALEKLNREAPGNYRLYINLNKKEYEQTLTL